MIVVAVRLEDSNELFEFDDPDDARSFCDELDEQEIDWSISITVP